MPPQQAPARPDRDAKPAVTVSLKCPSCGREPAVIFEVVRTGDGRPVEARRVCLECCPKVPGDPRPRAETNRPA
jgi:hypothetical protein